MPADTRARGYAPEAVAIFKAQDMTHATASDYKAAVGAAPRRQRQEGCRNLAPLRPRRLSARLQLLTLAAKFEVARGANGRAAEYYRASLSAMPLPDPGAELANELSRPVGNGNINLPGGPPSRRIWPLFSIPVLLEISPSLPVPPPRSLLRRLFAQLRQRLRAGRRSSFRARLPQYGSQYGVQQQQLTTPSYSTTPSRTVRQPPSTLGNYVPPQSSLAVPSTVFPSTTRPATLDSFVPPQAPLRNAINKPSTPRADPSAVAEVQDRFGIPSGPAAGSTRYATPGSSQDFSGPIIRMSATTSASPSAEQAQNQIPAPQTPAEAEAQATRAYQYQQIRSAIERAQTQPLPITQAPLSQPQPTQVQTASADPYGPYVPYTRSAVPVNLCANPTRITPPQPEMTDVIPQASYVPNARIKDPAYAPRRPRRRPGRAHPPSAVEPAHRRPRYTDRRLHHAAHAERTVQRRAGPRPTRSIVPSARGQALRTPPAARPPTAPPPLTTISSTRSPTAVPAPDQSTTPRRRARRAAKPAPAQNTTATTQLPGMAYPPVPQSLQPQPYPTIGATYPLGTLTAQRRPARRQECSASARL